MVQVGHDPAPEGRLYPRDDSGEPSGSEGIDDAQDVGLDAPERREAEAGRDQLALRLDNLLVQLAPEFSRSHLQGLIERGCVTLDGQLVTQASRKPKLGMGRSSA